MGAAWRSPKDRDLTHVEEMVREVRGLGLETCATLGMLEPGQAERLKSAGLDYYNHNIDTAPEYYNHIITTRDYEDRLDTLRRVRDAGIRVCSGGIIGMGESRLQRAGLIAQLANMDPYPDSVPINHLVQVKGMPLHGAESLDPLEFVRTIAVARITMPTARVQLSAGRREFGESIQSLCFMAGANSIFYGEKLLEAVSADGDHSKHCFVTPPCPTDFPLAVKPASFRPGQLSIGSHSGDHQTARNQIVSAPEITMIILVFDALEVGFIRVLIANDAPIPDESLIIPDKRRP